jgi:mono/diheme cytochrome c family protein
MNRRTFHVRMLAALAGAAGLAQAAFAAAPADLLNAYAAHAAAAPQPARGQQFFNVTHGREWSCASCHGAVPAQAGRHAGTGKPIAALAPAFNPERFTDAARTEKWFAAIAMTSRVANVRPPKRRTC